MYSISRLTKQIISTSSHFLPILFAFVDNWALFVWRPKIVWFCKIRNRGFSRVLWKGGSIENHLLFAVVIFLMGCWLFGPQVNALVTCIHCIGGLHCTDWIFGRKDWGHQAPPHRLQTDRIWDCGVVVKVPDQVGLLCYGGVVEGHTSTTCYLINSGRKPQQWNCLD